MFNARFAILLVLLLLIMLALSGCSSTPAINSTVRLITGTERIAKPPVVKPPLADFEPFEFDVPRDNSKLMVKNVSTCLDVPEAKRDRNFWAQCGIGTPLENSNIFLGFDEVNFRRFQSFLAALKAREPLLDVRFEEWNKERAAGE